MTLILFILALYILASAIVVFSAVRLSSQIDRMQERHQLSQGDHHAQEIYPHLGD